MRGYGNGRAAADPNECAACRGAPEQNGTPITDLARIGEGWEGWSGQRHGGRGGALITMASSGWAAPTINDPRETRADTRAAAPVQDAAAGGGHSRSRRATFQQACRWTSHGALLVQAGRPQNRATPPKYGPRSVIVP